LDYAVIGLGRFGKAMAIELSNQGNHVVGIDISEEECRLVDRQIEKTVIMNASSEAALKEFGIGHFHTVIVGIGQDNIADAILIAMHLKDLGVKRVVAKASNIEQKKILAKLDVDVIIRPEYDSAVKVAKRLQGNSVLDVIELSDEVRLDGLEVPDKCRKLIDKTIIEINLRKNYGINIICIQRKGDIIIPESNTLVKAGDIILVVGRNKDINKFEKESNIVRGE